MLLKNKTILLTGIASTRSIAFSIAQELSKAGANIIVTCQNEKLLDRVKQISQTLNVVDFMVCDVSSPESLEEFSSQCQSKFETLDGFVHAIAYAPADQLKGNFHEVISYEGFHIAHDVSSYSFCALAQILFPYLKKTQGSLVTLSYLGSERSIPNYNVMGLAKASLEASVRYLAASMGPDQVRVNAISAGPIRTLAASGIAGFKHMLDKCAQQNMLKRNVCPSEVAKTTLFLLSDLSSALTGQTIDVDCGFSKTAMVF